MRCLIVDDELQSRNTLKEELLLLNKGCLVIGEADNATNAIEQIEKVLPDLVLLDIELTNGSGFDVIEATKHLNYKTIFTTAYNQYAIQAFRVNAIDYLLKPISSKNLLEAIEKAMILKPEKQTEQLQKLLNQMKGNTSKISFSTADGFSVHDVKDIIYCEADNNYCKIFFINNDKIYISKTLKDLEDQLADYGFERIHKSYLININHIKKYLNKDGGHMLLSNGVSIPVAQRRRTDIISIMERIFL